LTGGQAPPFSSYNFKTSLAFLFVHQVWFGSALFVEYKMGKTRILLADDHTMVMDGLRKLLEPHFDIVGMATDGRKLMEIAPSLFPDVVLLDIGMPLLNGFDAGRQLKKLIPNTKLIVLTMNGDYELAAEALREWASGYLLKTSIGSELLRAVATVLRGERYLASAFAKRETEAFIRNPMPAPMKPLTTRQREILQLLAEGRSMKEVGAVLDVTTRTVAFHKYRIMEQYGLSNNSDLFRFAIKQNVVSDVEKLAP
jgi:DNA-binding NarL/FixJ family response regulator